MNLTFFYYCTTFSYLTPFFYHLIPDHSNELVATTTEDVVQEAEMDEGPDPVPSIEDDEDLSHPLSTAEILARREQLVVQYKFRIGLLASGLLEDPEAKVS